MKKIILSFLTIMVFGFYAKSQTQSCNVFMSNQDYINNEAFFVASTQNIIDSVRWIITDLNIDSVIFSSTQAPYNEQSTDTLGFYYNWPDTNNNYQIEADIYSMGSSTPCQATNEFQLGPQFLAHINIDVQGSNMTLTAYDNSQMSTDSIYWIVNENNNNIFNGFNIGSPLNVPYDSTSNYEISCYVYHTDGNFVLAGYGDTSLTNGALTNCDLQAYYYVMNANPNECNGMIQLNVYGGSGQYNYSWSDNSNYMDYYEMACPGTYSVTITDEMNDNCYVTLNDIIVGVSDSSYQYVDTFTNVLDTCLPSFNFDSLFLGNLSFPTDTTFEVNWYFVAGQDTFMFTQDYDFDTSGYYWLILGFNCDNFNKAVTSYGRSVYVDPTMTSNISLEISNFRIYPNPVKHEANITLFSSISESGSIKIYNLTGKEITTKNIRIKSGVNTYKLNTKSWENGIYVIKLETKSGQTLTRKVVK